MKQLLYQFGLFAGKLLLTILVLLIIFAFAFGGMVMGALAEFEQSYAAPVMQKIEEAGYFTCLNNQVEDTEFISVNCRSEVSEYKIINKFLAGYPNTEALWINNSAILETINQLDLPAFPEVASMPNSQELFDIVEHANELGPLSFFNLRDYGAVALEFISYFSKNGKELLTFLTSNSMAEVESFFATAHYAFVAAEQGLGYVEAIKGTVLPKKQIAQSAAIGLMTGMLVILVILITIRGVILLIQKWIREYKRKPRVIETEMDAEMDLARRDREFDNMVSRNR